MGTKDSLRATHKTSARKAGEGSTPSLLMEKTAVLGLLTPRGQVSALRRVL